VAEVQAKMITQDSVGRPVVVSADVLEWLAERQTFDGVFIEGS
jgi:hypothetical protein